RTPRRPVRNRSGCPATSRAPPRARRAMPSTLPAVPDVDEELADAVAARLVTVEERLRESVATSDDMARWTARHLMDAGGKRVRPLLVLLSASLGDIDANGVVDAAVLVELTHL